MRIYIRHGEKEYKNGQSRGCDPPLTKRGREETLLLAERLYSNFGLPTLIISSPFLRARETALLLRAKVAELSRKSKEEIPLLCDRKVGEYLGNQSPASQSLLTSETLSYHPLLEDNISSFLVRVREHNDILGSLEKDNFTFWIVSHGLVIKKLARFNGYFLPGYPNCLSGLIITEGKRETFGNWREN